MERRRIRRQTRGQSCGQRMLAYIENRYIFLHVCRSKGNHSDYSVGDLKISKRHFCASVSPLIITLGLVEFFVQRKKTFFLRPTLLLVKYFSLNRKDFKGRVHV